MTLIYAIEPLWAGPVWPERGNEPSNDGRQEQANSETSDGCWVDADNPQDKGGHDRAEREREGWSSPWQRQEFECFTHHQAYHFPTEEHPKPCGFQCYARAGRPLAPKPHKNPPPQASEPPCQKPPIKIPMVRMIEMESAINSSID